MSQIDKLNFIPHLFWFVILFLLFYFLIFSYLLPLIYQSLKVRKIFFLFVMKSVVLCNVFHKVLRDYYDLQLFSVFFESLYNLFWLICGVNIRRFGFLISYSKSYLNLI